MSADGIYKMASHRPIYSPSRKFLAPDAQHQEGFFSKKPRFPFKKVNAVAVKDFVSSRRGGHILEVKAPP